MNMKKMIQRMTDIENAAKKQLNESSALTECPPMEAPMAAPANPGNPVTMSITLNASGNDHVADLINLMKNAGLQDAKPAADAIMPMRQDMDRLRAIVGEPEMENDAAYAEVINDDELEEYDNEPNPEYQDHTYMTKDLSGGLNREKGAYAAAQDGDNAMAVEDDDTTYSIRGKTPDAQRELAKRADDSMAETIKKKLMAALSEKKAKPDFPDLDNDGDTKEPMKKALKDKGSKPKKGEVPPQFAKKK